MDGRDREEGWRRRRSRSDVARTPAFMDQVLLDHLVLDHQDEAFLVLEGHFHTITSSANQSTGNPDPAAKSG